MLTYEIISSVKRTFSRSKRAKTLKLRALVKKKGVRGGKMVQCSHCVTAVPMYKANLDHVDPICPVMISLKVMSFVMLYARTFCHDDNLQVLCKDCHTKKSNIEKGQRVKWRKKKKFLIVRVAQGGRMKVISITNLKELPEKWEVLNAFAKKGDADKDLKLRRKL